MVNKEKIDIEPIVDDDENWWASVLADETRYLVEETEDKEESEPVEEDEIVLDWELAQSLYKQDAIVHLTVIGHNRGGVLVEGENLKGFVPFSHLLRLQDNVHPDEREKTLATYDGETLDLKVIECVPDESRIVFSERAAQAGAGRRRELFSTLERGKSVVGDVTNITDFGVFVDLGGVEGLVHISELSWGRVAHPGDIVQMGSQIEVQILDISPERCRVALSVKRLHENPWANAAERYLPDQIVSAKVTARVPFGLFARLESGIEGLVHSSEIPDDKRNFAVGDDLELRVLHVDPKKQRMGLSLKI
jgi:small subunit ribosomal protein S1